MLYPSLNGWRNNSPNIYKTSVLYHGKEFPLKLRKKLTKSATHQHQTQKKAQQNDTKKKGHKTKSCTSVQNKDSTSSSVQCSTEHPAITEQTPEHDISTSVQVASSGETSPDNSRAEVKTCPPVQWWMERAMAIPMPMGSCRDDGCLRCCVSALVEGVATHMHYPRAYGLDFCTCFCHVEPRGPHKEDFEKLGAFAFSVGDGRVKISGICEGRMAWQARFANLFTVKCAGIRFEASAHVDWWDEYACTSRKNAKMEAASLGCIQCAQWHDEETDEPVDTFLHKCPCECHDPFPWDEEEDSSALTQAQSTSSFPPPSLEGSGNDEKGFDTAALHESVSLIKGRLSDKIPDATGISPRLSTPRELAEAAKPNTRFYYEPLPAAAFARPGDRPLLPKGAARLEREAIAREGLGQEQARLFGAEVEGFAAPALGFVGSVEQTLPYDALPNGEAREIKLSDGMRLLLGPSDEVLAVFPKEEQGPCRCGHTWESHQRRAPYATVCDYDYGGGNTCGCDEWRPQ